MTATGTVQDWFIAALMHDLGKTHGWQSPEGKGHGDWSETDYATTPAHKTIAERAREHEREISPESSLDDITLLALADKLQKGLYGASGFEGAELPPEIQRQQSRLMETPVFHSYYGNPTHWDKTRRVVGEAHIKECLVKAPTLANLLALQRDQLNEYPHTTYIPHLALGLHHQITAALFFLLWRRVRHKGWSRVEQIKNLTFHAFTITPEPLAFFARLRYLNVYEDTTNTLHTHLFRELFVPFQREGLSALTPTTNPFQFFHGSSLALLYDDPDDIPKDAPEDAPDSGHSRKSDYAYTNRVTKALQAYLDSPKVLLDSINLQIHSFTLREWGVDRRANPAGIVFADPNQIQRDVQDITILPSRATQFTAQTETRCMNCGTATPADELTTSGAKNLCVTCAQIERQKGIVDLKKFCPEGYLGWVFLSFESPLLDAALEQAQVINDEIAAQMMLPPGYLNPSATGFDEYFQALTHVQDFQAKCDQQIEMLGKRAKRLAHFTHLAIYLLCEDDYWKFLAFLNQERKQLRIPTTLRAFLCNAHYPVWSLMERGAEFDPKKRDLYYHIAQGSVAMFTATDVNTIRNLATLASSENVTSAQLSGLVNLALRATAPELFLEIDVKAREGKLGRGAFAGKLKEGLNALQADDDFGGREKRAIFIKYVKKLRGEDRR